MLPFYPTYHDENVLSDDLGAPNHLSDSDHLSCPIIPVLQMGTIVNPNGVSDYVRHERAEFRVSTVTDSTLLYADNAPQYHVKVKPCVVLIIHFFFTTFMHPPHTIPPQSVGYGARPFDCTCSCWGR